MSSSATWARVRPLELARGTWGLALLAAPRRVLAAVGERVPDRRTVVVTRVLGGRHLVQAAVTGLAPSRAVLADGAWVDGVHALTSLALAVGDRPRARLALLDAGIAGGWSLLTRGAARRSAPPDGPATSWIDRLARAVHPLLPGAPRL